MNDFIKLMDRGTHMTETRHRLYWRPGKRQRWLGWGNNWNLRMTAEQAREEVRTIRGQYPPTYEFRLIRETITSERVLLD